MKRMSRWFVFLFFCLVLYPCFLDAGRESSLEAGKESSFPAGEEASEKKQLVIGSKIFTENILLAEMLALLLEEKYNFRIIRKFGMGGTKLNFDALRNRQIDVYPEYTGTGYSMLLKLSGETDPRKTYKIVKEEFLKSFDLLWSLPLGFENTYALAVKRQDSRFQNIKRVSQLRGRVQQFRLGADHEFSERKDGFQNFSNRYRLGFSKDHLFTMNPGLMYSALNSGELDMIMAYSTDGRIKAFGLKILKDDKKFFPSYSAAFLTRAGLIEQRPELKRAFRDLEGGISEKDMISLNYQVDQLKQGIVRTARNFLIEKGVLDDAFVDLKKQGLVAYYLSKKKYFFKIFREHLALTFISLFLALLFALPVGVWASRNSWAEKSVFAVINTLQTVPSLALLAVLIPFLGIGFAPAVTALFIYSLLPLIRNTCEGIKNVDRSYVEAGAGMGLSSWQILRFIQIPLALPVILAGLRTSAVIVVGTAVLAAFIGAGGLGDPIFRGIATLNSRMIFLGAVPAALLALFLDKGLAVFEAFVLSKGLKLEKNIKDIEF